MTGTRNSSYRFSFTAGALETAVCALIAQKYLENNDWEETLRQSVAQNLLQTRTENSCKRITGELILRLGTLSREELNIFVDSSQEVQKIWLWIGICRAYRLIREFAVEVVREHYLSGSSQALSLADFDTFCERKSIADDSIAKLSKSTYAKVRQKTFQLLMEVGLISRKKEVQGMAIDGKTFDAVPVEDQYCFPVYVKR